MANFYQIRILFVVLAAIGVCSGQDVTVRISSENDEVEQGDTFSFTCMVANLQGGSSFLQIQKYFHDDPDPITFTTNTIISQEFRDVERFAISFEQKDGELHFKFTVSDALAEDGGDYSCAMYGANGIIVDDRKSIIVKNIEPFSVEMAVKRISNEEELILKSEENKEVEISLDESEDFAISVTTSRTMPAADLQFFVGSHEITDQFTIDTVPAVEEGTHPNLKVLTYTTRAIADKLRVDHSYSSGFKVKASAGGIEKELSMAVKFSGYPPTIEEQCYTEIIAINHDKNKMFNCSFMSSEAPEVYIYYFRELLSGEEKEVLYPGEEDSKYEFVLHEMSDSMTYKASLRMEIVYPQMFREYYLVVKNNLGNITHKFEVVQDPNAELPNGGTSHLAFPLATLFMFIMTTLIANLS